jgi:hypothetical protein
VGELKEEACNIIAVMDLVLHFLQSSVETQLYGHVWT